MNDDRYQVRMARTSLSGALQKKWASFIPEVSIHKTLIIMSFVTSKFIEKNCVCEGAAVVVL